MEPSRSEPRRKVVLNEYLEQREYYFTVEVEPAAPQVWFSLEEGWFEVEDVKKIVKILNRAIKEAELLNK